MIRILAKLLLALLLTGWSVQSAHAQGSKRPTLAKVKPKRVVPGLSLAVAAEATAFLQENLKISTATANFCKSLKRLEQANAALQKYPGNKRLLLRLNARMASAKKLATALNTLLDPTGSHSKVSSGKMARPSAPLHGGAKTLLTLTSKVSKTLGTSMSLTSSKDKTGLGDSDLSSLDSAEKQRVRDRETLLGIIEPVIYR